MTSSILRPFAASDAEALTALLARVDRTYLSSRLPDPYTAEDARARLREIGEKEGRRGVYRAIVSGGQLAGCVYAEMQDFPEGSRDANLTCYLDPEACGQGLGSRAVAEVTALAFACLPVVRLTAWICGPNTPSRRCVEKAGFSQEACLRQAAAHGEENWDLTIYGKLRTEQV